MKPKVDRETQVRRAPGRQAAREPRDQEGKKSSNARDSLGVAGLCGRHETGVPCPDDAINLGLKTSLVGFRLLSQRVPTSAS